MTHFEKKAKMALLVKEMTMKELAKKLGISESYVSLLISGKRSNDERLKAIRKELDI